MMVPLHIRPDDYSPEACHARLMLHYQMAQLNPKGWRKPRSMVKARSKLKVGARHLRSPHPRYRLDTLGVFARLAGKAAVAESAKT